MTSPAPVGYPDWLRTFATSRTLFSQDIALSSAVTVIRGPFMVANAHSVAISMRATTNHVGCLLDWSQDSAGTVATFRDSIDVRQGTRFEQTVTCKGPWLKVTLLPFPGLGVSSVFDFTLAESPFEFVGNRTSDTAAFMVVSVNIGAGATDTQIGPRVMVAPAVFSLIMFGATNWSAVVSSIDAQGNTDRLIQVDQSSPHVPFPFYLPSIPVQVAVTNNDAGAHLTDYQIVAKTLYP
jgi:hypothetical protein